MAQESQCCSRCHDITVHNNCALRSASFFHRVRCCYAYTFMDVAMNMFVLNVSMQTHSLTGVFNGHHK